MNDKKQSLWLHYGISASIVLVTLLSVAWYATDRFHDFFIHQQQETLESRAITVDQAIKTRKTNNACHVLRTSDPSLRVTIVDTLGVVLCDSEADAIMMENHAERPEISQALKGQRGSSTRMSETLQTSMLYLAIPYFKDEKIVGAIRTAIPLLSIENLLDELYRQFVILLMVLFAIISMVIINIYRKINQPLDEIVEEARRYAKGDFSNALPDYDIREIAELGGALNQMAEQLDRLENLRQDFVANVSHELKTPIATIKSYVETLLDGAQHDPADLERFLNIVLKQNDRLAAIVDDLLTLSRLESAPVTQILALAETDACQLLHASAENCQSRAEAKNITINISCNENIFIQVDHSLMTQALVNLIDNAIKYSNENKTISLSVEEIDKQVLLSISDQGPGIPEQHIPRLFERFYRVDKSRSRRIGGTGLGLAIVKHIVHIHGGQVEVSNNVTVGCRFVIKLPQSD
ncbi:MAG: ATP-binding protein [Gammaproteobacteria bacterium]|nr:ATP-binding protein [Gammaproteobacteria bacterium]MCW8924573.1 ATP-binding protein [Gammaproteobacteria bacterium]